jgi:tetratricopeptide (TPR) repeat protein
LVLGATVATASEPSLPKTRSQQQFDAQAKAAGASTLDPIADKPGDDKKMTADLRTEIDSYAKLAREAADANKMPLAEHFLELIVNLPAPMAEKKNALLAMAEMYEKQRTFSKAIAVYEKMADLFPSDADTPQLLMKVALLYRESGANQLAIARLYSVLNAALKGDGGGFEDYRALAQRAQMEIAETYMLAADYEQARKFYMLLKRVDNLPAEDKAKVRFKAAYCQYILGQMGPAIAEAEGFLKDFPEDASVPETRYLLASAIKGQNRPKDALEQVLVLLREENKRKQKSPERWSYWQRKAGNEFANDFFQKGDFLSALTIYQALAKLNAEADWQWPAIYQMGLCFERLGLTERAAQAYKYLIDDAAKPNRQTEKIADAAKAVPGMAEWRGQQLAWRHDTTSALDKLIGQPLYRGDAPELALDKPAAPAALPPPSAAPAPAAAPDPKPPAPPAPQVMPPPSAPTAAPHAEPVTQAPAEHAEPARQAATPVAKAAAH